MAVVSGDTQTAVVVGWCDGSADLSSPFVYHPGRHCRARGANTEQARPPNNTQQQQPSCPHAFSPALLREPRRTKTLKAWTVLGAAQETLSRTRSADNTRAVAEQPGCEAVGGHGRCLAFNAGAIKSNVAIHCAIPFTAPRRAPRALVRAEVRMAGSELLRPLAER